MKRIWKWIGAVVCLVTAMVLSGATDFKGRVKAPVSTKPHSAKPISKMLRGKDGVYMVLIPAGYFWMGSPEGRGDGDEHPRHKVWVDKFYMDEAEVTFNQYDKFCSSTGKKKPSDNGWGRGNRPVININWQEAQSYCKWAGKRLPTEAEWEKACRGGTATKRFWGNDVDKAEEYVWDSKNSDNMTHPVCTKKPNPFGLYDVLGNVWEWCSDRYGSNYYTNSPERNPQGPERGRGRVLRGGTWNLSSEILRSADRFNYNSGVRYKLIGCRCAKTP